MGKTRAGKAAAERFMFDHAGWSYRQGEDPDKARQACAVKLASAERWLAAEVEAGHLRVDWRADEDFDPAGLEDEDRRSVERGETLALACIIANAHGPVASLWGILVGDTSDPYCRVVEAELALEVRA